MSTPSVLEGIIVVFVIGFFVHLGTYYAIGKSANNYPAASVMACIGIVVVFKLSWWLVVMALAGHFCSVFLCDRLGKRFNKDKVVGP